MKYKSRSLAVFFSLLFSIDLCAAATPSAPISVPFQLDSELPTINATILGKPATLILDLGGFSGLALGKHALQRIPVEFSHVSLSWRNAMGEVFTTRRFNAVDLQAGTFHVNRLDGIELAPGQSGSIHDGYIGFGLLKDYLLVFDYPEHILHLYPSGSMQAMKSNCGTDTFPIDISDGVVESRIEADKGQFIFQWDTGASESVVRPSALGMTSADAAKLGSFATSRFQIGKRDFGRTRITLKEFVAPNVDGVLGTDFLESKVLCIDPKNHLAAIK